MRQVIVKKIRKYIYNHNTELLINIRNEFGEKTEDMNERQIYQNTKKLYKARKISII